MLHTTTVTNVISVAAGSSNYVILQDGTVWCYNWDFTQSTQVILPLSALTVVANDRQIAIILCDGSAYINRSSYCGRLIAREDSTDEFVHLAHDVVSIALGKGYVLCVTSDGEVYGLGKNDCYQLGMKGKNISRLALVQCPGNVIRIFAQDETSFILTETGDMYSCGNNYFGQTGLMERSQILIRTPTNLIKFKVRLVVPTGTKTFVITEDRRLRTVGGSSESAEIDTSGRPITNMTTGLRDSYLMVIDGRVIGVYDGKQRILL